MKTFALSALALLTTLPAFAGGSSTVGPGNPAAYFCLDKGGDLEQVRLAAGYDSLCNFGRAGIAQWTLFNASSGQDAVNVFFHPKKVKPSINGNPASLFCEAQGGKSKLAKLEGGGEIGLCEFADGSGIEEWTLFRGPTDESNAALVKALR